MTSISSPTESNVGYSAEEMAEMKRIFNKYDKDGDGHLNAHLFTYAVQSMDYKYNEDFVTQVLKLVFDAKWETKKDNLLFDDFKDFMSEFEPVHYEVIDKIEEKLKKKNINDVNIDDEKITNLLKYAQMKNGTLLLNEIDKHLDELQINNAEVPEPTLPSPSITENIDVESTENVGKVGKVENNNVCISKMSTHELFEWLDTDKTFNTTLTRRECCNIIQTQQWNGNDLIQALKLDKMSEILLLFKNIQNYQYIMQSLKKLNPSDINCSQLIKHLESIQNGSMPPEDVQDADLPQPQQIEFKTSLNVPQTTIDGEDEIYIQNVWKEILRFFDDNDDGTIDVEEMGTALRALGIDVNDNKLNDMIRKMDEDKSGSIDYSDFKTYYNSLFKNKMKQGLNWKYLQTMFEKYDIDSSGSLDISEFAFVLKQICSNINDADIQSILHLIDISGDDRIEFEEFISFLHSEHPKAKWVLKKIIRSSIATPIEYLIAFKGLPQHFRKSELAQIANHNSFKISQRLKPQIDSDGITLKNIKIDPRTHEIQRKYSERNDSYNEEYYLQNIRIFSIRECEGVPLPEATMAARIVGRRVRLCLYANDKAISNVFTIPASWKQTEEDQWKFGGNNVWKDSLSATVSEWNTFCVSIPHNVTGKMELFIELCITIKQEADPDGSGEEMLCGWSKLEIHNTKNINVCSHKLKIYGGTLQNESVINETDIRNDTSTSLSFRKLKQALTSIQSVIKIEEESYNNFSAKNKEYVKWMPENIIIPVSGCKIIELYYELMADCWCRNKRIFNNFQFFTQNLYQTLLLFIIDRPNLLCILIDEWKLKLDSFWRSQKNDNKFVKKEFKILIKQFIALLVNYNLIENQLTSLNQQRLSFVKQIIKGNIRQILNGNKASSSIPLIYAPFTTDLFLS